MLFGTALLLVILSAGAEQDGPSGEVITRQMLRGGDAALARMAILDEVHTEALGEGRGSV